jgi:predicted HAD superfamily Cof-like phosphohydrolase
MSSRPHSNAARLRDFHRAAGLSCADQPTVPAPDLLALRRTLIHEEAQEVEAEFMALAARLDAGEAASPADLAPLAHELADLLYVTYGALDALGIDADAVFAEVHRANMSKLGGPRRADGKLLKPEGWQPADVRGVLERSAARR